jgi:hypothetical protein
MIGEGSLERVSDGFGALSDDELSFNPLGGKRQRYPRAVKQEDGLI